MGKSKSKNSQAIKAQLRVLKSKGLYSGDLRKAPTDYGKRLARKYADVVSGKAAVTSVKPVAGKRSSGLAAARKQAKDIAAAYASQVRAKGTKLIVQTVSPTDRLVYSPKTKTLEIRRQRGADTIERIPLKSEAGLSENEDGTLDLTIRDLKSNESYYVPFVGKNGGVRYTAFADKAALFAAINKYQHWGDIAGNIVISRTEPKRKRKGNALAGGNV